MNQEFEGVNYTEMNPVKMPFPNTKNNSSSPISRNNIEWLNSGDSIDSLQQASAGFTMVAPNSARRMDPIRMSVPRGIGGPVTQRGRCGKLGDSQQYNHI